MIVGAAPIHRSVLEYFMSVNMPILELFGMSENSGPQSFNRMDNWQLGSVGLPMLGTQVKIDSPDEKGEGEVRVGAESNVDMAIQLENRTRIRLEYHVLQVGSGTTRGFGGGATGSPGCACFHSCMSCDLVHHSHFYVKVQASSF